MRTRFCTLVKNCGVFNNLPVGARWDLVKQKEWCPWCLSHWINKDCYSIQKLEKINRKPECGEGGCKQPHHPLLHHLQGNLSSLRLEVTERPVEASNNYDHVSVKSRCYLVPQIDVVVVGGVTAVVQYDSGSQCSSISADFAKRQGIQGRMCDVILEDGLSLSGTRVTEVHELPIKTGPNQIVNHQFFELPAIGTGGPVEDLPTNLKSFFFPGCESREWATWDGQSVDIVIGMDNADLFPMPLAWRDSLILSKSVLTNLLIVWGREERVQRLDLGPLEVNELMPEAHMFNQSIVDHSICIQEVPEIVVPEIVVPSAPELEPSAPEPESSDPEPEQPTSQVEEQVQEKVVIPPAKVFFEPLPWVISSVFIPLFLYLCSLGSHVEAFTTFFRPAADRDCPSTLPQIFRGDMRSCVNGFDSSSLENGVAVLERADQVAGPVLPGSVPRCPAVESEFSQSCGHSPAAGVLQILKFREMMLDAVGFSFVPCSMLLLMLFFVISVARIFVTIVVRAVIISRASGCDPWIFAAVWGIEGHILISPAKSPDDWLATLLRMLANSWRMRPPPTAARPSGHSEV